MQTLGSWLQLGGTLIAGAGFLYAWNRLMCGVQSSPDWRDGHGDAPVGPTMKGSPRPRFASDTATGAPRSRTFRVREGVS